LNFRCAPFLVALTADDAPIDPARTQNSLSLVESIQKAAIRFPPLSCLSQGKPFSWSSLELNVNPVEIGGRYCDGFRFTTPEPSRT